MAIGMMVALLALSPVGLRYNNMADQATQQTPQEDTRPPWEINYNPVVETVSKAVKTATDTITTAVKGILPWEQNYAAKRPVEAPRPIQPQGQGFDFNQVFNKLVGAESRGVHETGGKLTTSPVGAQGITQVMPKTGANPGYGVTPIQNNSKDEYLRFGRDYLRAMLKEFDGDYEKAVAAYNAGAGSVKKAITQATKKGGDWKDYLPKKSETLPYLNKILGGK